MFLGWGGGDRGMNHVIEPYTFLTSLKNHDGNVPKLSPNRGSEPGADVALRTLSKEPP